MSGSFIIRELAVVVVGRNHNPTILNPDFLVFNDVVPRDWELAKPPMCTDLIAQVVYRNGLTIVSQFDKIIFSEPFRADGSGPVDTPEVAARYLRTVPHVDYQAVGVNPNGHVAFEAIEAAEAYVKEHFLLNGPWASFGDGLRRAGIKLSYEVGDRTLNLTIEAGSLGEANAPVVLFGGNFHHDLVGETTKERLESALGEVAKWQDDIAMLRRLVEQQILREEKS